MHKSDMEKKPQEIELRKFLQKSAEDQEIPQTLLPEQMEEWLRRQTSSLGQKGEEPMNKKDQENQRKKRTYRLWWGGSFATAACLALLLFATGKNIDWEIFTARNCHDPRLQRPAPHRHPRLPPCPHRQIRKHSLKECLGACFPLLRRYLFPQRQIEKTSTGRFSLQETRHQSRQRTLQVESRRWKKYKYLPSFFIISASSTSLSC